MDYYERIVDLTPEEAVAILEGLSAAGDQEEAHGRADDALLGVLRPALPEVARAYVDAKIRVGFWYA